jgi:hypothetical protein
MSNKKFPLLFSILFGIALGVVLTEVGLRLWQGSLIQQDKFLDTILGDHHKPGDQYWYQTEEFKTFVQINSKGLRDYEYPYKKDKGVFRILVLGDSFTDGLQVPLEDTFPKVLERKLNEQARTPQRRYEVLNAGHHGDGTGRQLLFFQYEGYKYNPDIVLLAIYTGNDIRNNQPELESIHRVTKYGSEYKEIPGPYFVLTNKGLELRNFPYTKPTDVIIDSSGIDDQIKTFLTEHSYTYRMVRDYVKTKLEISHLKQISNPQENEITSQSLVKSEQLPYWLDPYRPVYSSQWEQAWLITELLLAKLKREVEAHDARLIVVILNPRQEIEQVYWEDYVEEYPEIKNWDTEKPNHLIGAILQKQGIVYLQLASYLRRYVDDTGHKIYLAQDGHFTNEGYHLVGEQLTLWFIENGMLESTN